MANMMSQFILNFVLPFFNTTDLLGLIGNQNALKKKKMDFFFQ